MMNLRHGRLLGVLLTTTLVASACSRGEAEAPAGGAGRGADQRQPGGAGGPGGAGRGPGGRGGGGPVPVTTAQVAKKDMPLELRIIGSVAPYSTVAVHAQITGE